MRDARQIVVDGKPGGRIHHDEMWRMFGCFVRENVQYKNGVSGTVGFEQFFRGNFGISIRAYGNCWAHIWTQIEGACPVCNCPDQPADLICWRHE